VTEEPAGAIVLITRLARSAYRVVDEGSLGMRLKEFTALSALRDTDGRGQKQLGEALLLDANNLSLLLNALEDRGLVTRAPVLKDRRRHFVDITAQGRVALAAAEEAIDAADDGVLRRLTVEERAQLRKLAAKALGDEAHR
jgi:DNA-binding MarR family transcriptional regulator